jgi:hypothetical protein
MTTVWIYVDTNYLCWPSDHAADEWFSENDPEGVAFGYEVLGEKPGRDLDGLHTA